MICKNWFETRHWSATAGDTFWFLSPGSQTVSQNSSYFVRGGGPVPEGRIVKCRSKMSNTVPVASKPFIFRKKSIIAGRVESNAAKTSACRNKLITEAVEKCSRTLNVNTKRCLVLTKTWWISASFYKLYNNYSIDFWHVYEVLKHFFSNKKTDDF